MVVLDSRALNGQIFWGPDCEPLLSALACSTNFDAINDMVANGNEASFDEEALDRLFESCPLPPSSAALISAAGRGHHDTGGRGAINVGGDAAAIPDVDGG